jgi:FAD/FMN-containing dehydrogenase
LLKREKTDKPLSNTISDAPPALIKRLVFRGGVGSDYGKDLRWQLETLFGETAGMLLSRNQIMNEPSSWFANRDAGSAEILHEYFLPISALGEFFKKAKPVFARHRPDLLNITVRNVETDRDSFLRYARQEVFGVVMLFHQGRDEASEQSMRAFARDLLAVVLACQGTYYLPYRPHATLEQFQEAYPQAREFFTLKKRYDPEEIFQNQFYQKYGRPLLSQP